MAVAVAVAVGVLLAVTGVRTMRPSPVFGGERLELVRRYGGRSRSLGTAPIPERRRTLRKGAPTSVSSSCSVYEPRPYADIGPSVYFLPVTHVRGSVVKEVEALDSELPPARRSRNFATPPPAGPRIATQ